MCLRRYWNALGARKLWRKHSLRSSFGRSGCTPDPDELFRLGEEHEHARPAIGQELIFLFERSVRDCQAIASFVVGWLAIDEDHVVVRFIALDMMEGDVPCIQNAVTHHRSFLPMIERANDFDSCRFLGLSVRQTPAEHF